MKVPQPVVEEASVDHKRQYPRLPSTTTPEAQRRVVAEVSVAELARRIGVSRQTLWRWERGDVEPPALSRRAWHAALARAETALARRLAP